MSKFDGIKWELMPGQLRCSGIEPPDGAKVLRRFRESKGMTCEEFGMPLLMGSKRIKDLERGIRRITPYVALLIEREYGISSRLLLE